MATLMDLFKTNPDGPIVVDGGQLFATYYLHVEKGDLLVLTFLHAVPRPVQGIGVVAKHCQVAVAGSAGKALGLWTDTAPESVELRVIKAKAGASVGFFNQWRDEKYGSTMYHLNNAAMKVEPQADGSLMFRCSDGWEGPDFNELVFQIAHRRREQSSKR